MFKIQAQQTREDFKNLQMEVFTQSAKGLRLYDFKPLVCAFDEQGLIEKRLNAQGRADNPDLIKSLSDTEKEALTKSFSCRLKALAYGIQYLPAAVLASKEVIYGYADLREVEKIWMDNHG